MQNSFSRKSNQNLQQTSGFSPLPRNERGLIQGSQNNGSGIYAVEKQGSNYRMGGGGNRFEKMSNMSQSDMASNLTMSNINSMKFSGEHSADGGMSPGPNTHRGQNQFNFQNLQPTMEDDQQAAFQRMQGGLGKGINIKKQLDIKNGQPLLNQSIVSQSTNKIKISSYGGSYLGILWFLYDLMVNIDHFLLLLNLIFIYNSDHQGGFKEYQHVLAIFGVSVVIRTIILLTADQNKKYAADSVNLKPVERFVFTKKKQGFQIVNWQDLHTGDIIKIRNNQEVPAECLILSIFDKQGFSKTCYAKGGFMSENIAPILKTSYSAYLNKPNLNDNSPLFFEKITGLLKWEYNHFGLFTGSLKHQEDQKAVDIKSKNVIQRGCYLQKAKFVICMVLNVGHDCSGYNFIQGSKTSTSIIKKFYKQQMKEGYMTMNVKKLLYFYLYSALFCLVPLFINLFQEKVMSQSEVKRFVSAFSVDPTLNQAAQYFSILSNFMYNLPYLAQATVEGVVIFHIMFALWDVNLVPADLKFNNSNSMKYLGQVDSVICPMEALFLQNVCQIAAFKIDDEVIYNQKDGMEEKEEENDDTSDFTQVTTTDRDDNEEENGIGYLPNIVDRSPYFQHTEINHLLSSQNKNRKLLYEFLKAILVAHEGYTSSSQLAPVQQNPDGPMINKYHSLYKEDVAQLYFARSFGFKFLNRRDQILTVNYLQSQHRFEQVLTRRIGTDQNQVRIYVIKPFTSTQTSIHIYYKAPLRVISGFVTPQVSKKCQLDVGMFESQGIHAWGIAKRTLDAEDALEFLRLIQDDSNEARDRNIQARTDRMLMNLANELRLVGVYGLQLEYNYRDYLMTEDLMKNGMKLYLLNQDCQESTITDLNTMSILNDYDEPLKIVGNNERQIEESIKECLKEVTKRRLQISSKIKKIQTNGGQQSQVLDEALSHLLQSPNIRNKKRSKPKQKEKNSDKAEKEREIQKKKKQRDFEKSEFQNNVVDFENLQQRNLVLIDGQQLQFILMDETLSKLFQALCNMSQLIVGSQVSTQQRQYFTKAIKQYSRKGQMGNILGIISSNADRLILKEADITIAIANKYKSTDLLAQADIQMNNLYGLTYLLLKHGTLVESRISIVIKEFIKRTVLFSTVSLAFYFMQGFSFQMPVGQFFFIFYMVVQTPFQFWLEGITYQSYGYNIMHRIFGNYKFNMVNNEQFSFYSGAIIEGLIEALILIVYNVCTGIIGLDKQMSGKLGSCFDEQALLIQHAMIFEIFTLFRSSTAFVVIYNIAFAQLLCLIISIITVFDDEYLVGYYTIQSTPNALFFILFALLFAILKWSYRVIWYALPFNSDVQKKYKEMEEKIYLEEYEDPHQQFSIKTLDHYTQVINDADLKLLFSINENLLSVKRTESLDYIIEGLNFSQMQGSTATENLELANLKSNKLGKSSNTSMYINKCNLRLYDMNKDQEYNEKMKNCQTLYPHIPILWITLVFFIVQAVYKIVMTVMAQSGEPAQSPTMTENSIFNSFSFEIVMVIMLLIVIIAIKKKFTRADIIVWIFLVFWQASQLMMIYNTDGYFQQLILVQYIFTITVTFALRHQSVFGISFMTSIFALLSIQFKFTKLQFNATGPEIVQIIWFTVCVLVHFSLHFIYAVWDQIFKKIQYVKTQRIQKELQKLQNIQAQIMPKLSIDNQEKKGAFSDLQSDVTIIVVSIYDFSILTKTHNSVELIDILNQFFEGLYRLSQEYKIEKIQCVGKYFIACAGIPHFEKVLDLISKDKHSSIKVVNFASEALKLASTIIKNDGTKLQIQIGIHTGGVVSGILGEIKPQFTFIGETFTKAKKISDMTVPNKITISQQTNKHVARFFSVQKKELQIPTQGFSSVNNQNLIVYYVERRKPEHGLKQIMGKKKKIFYKQKSITGADIQVEQDPMEGAQTSGLESERAGEKGEMNTPSSHHSIFDGLGLEDKLNLISIDEGSNQSLINSKSGDKNEQQDSFVKLIDSEQSENQILRQTMLNDKYQLVERPKYLFQFESREFEHKFSQLIFTQHMGEEILYILFKTIMDIILFVGIIYAFEVTQLSIYLATTAGFIIFKILLHFFLKYAAKISMILTTIIRFVTFFFTLALIYVIGPLRLNFISKEVLDMTFCVFFLVAFNLRTWDFRVFFSFTVIYLSAIFATDYMYTVQKKINYFQYVGVSCQFLLLSLLYLFLSHQREMNARISFNRMRIVEVETKHYKEQISRMVPQHVLKRIKDDQQVLDFFQNITLCDFEIIGVSEFIKHVSAKEVIATLGRIFAKFDNLIDQMQVYKVHSLCCAYTVMGYSGKTHVEKRSQEEAILEGYNVLRFAHQIIDVLHEEKQKSSVGGIQFLDLKIGIHTGRIFGGIHGIQQIQYDIFGHDVRVSALIRNESSNCLITVSENFHNLIQQKPFIYDTFSWQDSSILKDTFRNMEIKLYKVEQIFLNDQSSDEELSLHNGGNNPMAFSINSREKENF